MTAPTQYAAILRQNVRTPLVYGIGATPEEARADATEWADDLSELEVFPCTDALVRSSNSGKAECEIVDGVATVEG